MCPTHTPRLDFTYRPITCRAFFKARSHYKAFSQSKVLADQTIDAICGPNKGSVMSSNKDRKRKIIHINPDIFKAAARYSYQQGLNLSRFIEEAVAEKLMGVKVNRGQEASDVFIQDDGGES